MAEKPKAAKEVLRSLGVEDGKLDISFHRLDNGKIIDCRGSTDYYNSEGLAYHWWFGLPKDNLVYMLESAPSESFILYVCGLKERTFVIPIGDLSALLNIPTSTHDHWKIHIYKRQDGFKFMFPMGGGKIDISNYLNRYDLLELQPADDFYLPEELSSSSVFCEGVKRPITVNTYERSAEARRKCIAHHGTKCAVCGFDFSDKYGAVGAGFIHVHHILPLSSLESGYSVNPIEDLRPVCPNCHAIIHKQKPPYQIDEVKQLISQATGIDTRKSRMPE